MLPVRFRPLAFDVKAKSRAGRKDRRQAPMQPSFMAAEPDVLALGAEPCCTHSQETCAAFELAHRTRKVPAQNMN